MPSHHSHDQIRCVYLSEILISFPIVTAVLRGKWTNVFTPRNFDEREEVPFQCKAEVAKGNGRRSGYGKSLELSSVCTKFLSLWMPHMPAPTVYACSVQFVYIAVSIEAALFCCPLKSLEVRPSLRTDRIYKTYGFLNQRCYVPGMCTELYFHVQLNCVIWTYSVEIHTHSSSKLLLGFNYIFYSECTL